MRKRENLCQVSEHMQSIQNCRNLVSVVLLCKLTLIVYFDAFIDYFKLC